MGLGLAGFLLDIGSCGADTLQDALRAASMPTQSFPAAELAGKITSYAVSNGDPFLLAYYDDDGSVRIQPPLHVVRYDRAAGEVRRADFRNVLALFQGETPMDCLGSALTISQYRGFLYIDTHGGPSAGCVLIFSTGLELKASLSGWLLGRLGADYAIVRGSEVHFMSVHPTHIVVFDLKQNRSVTVYPYANDPERQRFSRLIEPWISESWCRENNAACDPENFDADLTGSVAVNESARVFGFEARFDAGGFGEAAEKTVAPRTVTYFYRERGGAWEHREYQGPALLRLLGGMTLDEFIRQKPDLAFR